jgi:hypothetical protein
MTLKDASQRQEKRFLTRRHKETKKKSGEKPKGVDFVRIIIGLLGII